jgi:extradiol dioxygenase family protein
LDKNPKSNEFRQFHLSIGVRSISESIDFFESTLGAGVTHRDPSGYVNIDLFGTQITLKQNDNVVPDLPDFHFGVNMCLGEFDRLATRILERGRRFVAKTPEVWDAGTPMERKKMYLKCPTGYLIELKGYDIGS